MALSGCAAEFQNCSLKSPEGVLGGSHYSASPYVKLYIGGGGQYITVGNESAPHLENNAVIKDFEYGSADGFKARFSIHDQHGGSLSTFMNRMLKDINKSSPEAIQAHFEFGWIRSGCPVPVAVKKSTKRWGFIDSGETNFADGKFMYDIVVGDLGEVTNDGKTPKIYGEDGDKGMPLRQAIEKLLTDKTNPPYVSKVSFKTSKGGQITDVGFEKPTKGDKNGQKTKWIGNNRPKLNTAMEWLTWNLSENGKNWRPVYNDEAEGGEIIFFEDNMPMCGENKNDPCLGTYIVNGGKESTVLEFNPRFKWNWAVLAQGGSVGENTILNNASEGGKHQGRQDCRDLSGAVKQGGGSQTTLPIPDGLKDIEGKNASKVKEKGTHMHMRSFTNSTVEPITADLVVVGDPDIAALDVSTYRTVSLVFINPFHLVGGGSRPEWVSRGLSGTACNEILSNRQWMVKSVTHKISSGKFTTTLNLYLPVPGTHFDFGQPAGGDSKGWVPPPV